VGGGAPNEKVLRMGNLIFRITGGGAPGGLFGSDGESDGDLSAGDNSGSAGESNGYLPPLGSSSSSNVPAFSQPPQQPEGTPMQITFTFSREFRGLSRQRSPPSSLLPPTLIAPGYSKLICRSHADRLTIIRCDDIAPSPRHLLLPS
jgi:hypothetical protein